MKIFVVYTRSKIHAAFLTREEAEAKRAQLTDAYRRARPGSGMASYEISSCELEGIVHYVHRSTLRKSPDQEGPDNASLE